MNRILESAAAVTIALVLLTAGAAPAAVASYNRTARLRARLPAGLLTARAGS
ncbi:hypothetical protein [Streptomyces sp. NPDC055912]|uniref:hypothetical protein n=1 Tax=Streptomyces sp. NPDC055912 TaxID=3345660 RepID=UPI0035D9AB88